MKVLWTPLARRRLADIEAYIAQHDPKAAHAIAGRLVARSHALERLPRLGRRLHQYPSAEIRELLERPFRLIFRVTPERIEVLTVMHYRQLLPSDLAELMNAGVPTKEKH